MAAVASSCSTVGSRLETRTALARGEQLLLQGDPASALEAFRTVGGSAGQTLLGARARVGEARCRIELGQYDQALALLYQARKAQSGSGAQSSVIDRAIGEAYFQKREYSLAARHLQGVLDKTRGEERDQVLIRLSICAERAGDLSLARSYFSALANPSGAGVLRVRVEHSATAGAPPDRVARSPKASTSSRGDRRRDAAAGGGLGRSRGLSVVPRARWGAERTRHNVRAMGRPTRLTVHHTGGNDLFWGTSFWETASQIKKIQSFHQKQRNWADIGYHYIIDRAGRVWEGRPVRYQGAHAGDSVTNKQNIGVVLLGNFVRQRPSRPQVEALERFLAQLCGKYGIPPHRVHTHHELRDTSCPGPLITGLVKTFRRRQMAARTPMLPH